MLDLFVTGDDYYYYYYYIYNNFHLQKMDVLLGHQQGRYLTHIDISQNKSKGKDQADLVYAVLQEYNSEDTIKAVLVDNTSLNTGGEHKYYK